jgi:hypothetical protein
MSSAGSRPNRGEPQMRMSSFVCSGPATTSVPLPLETKWISPHPTVRSVQCAGLSWSVPVKRPARRVFSPTQSGTDPRPSRR